MNNKKKYHHGDLKSAVIQTALEMMASTDPSAISVRQIAKQLGVTATAVYTHFDNKDALLTSLAQHGFDLLLAKMNEAIAQSPKEDHFGKLASLSRAIFNFAQLNHELFKLMFSPQFARLHKEDGVLGQSSHDSFELLETELTEYLDGSGNPINRSVATLYVCSFIHGLCHLVIADRLSNSTVQALDQGGLLHDMLNIFKKGIEADSTASSHDDIDRRKRP